MFFSIGKNRRLKQAKEEAQAEIEQYRLQREKEFKTKEAAVRIIHFLIQGSICILISISVFTWVKSCLKIQYFSTVL